MGKTFDQLDAITSVASGDLFAVDDISETKTTKATATQLFTYISAQQFDNIYLNEAVALTSTSTELNQLDGVTVGGNSAGDILTTDDSQTLSNKAFSQDGAVTITDVGSAADENPLNLLGPNATSTIGINIGTAVSNNNAASILFNGAAGSGSANNYVQIGVRGTGVNTIISDGSGNVSIGTGAISTGAALQVGGEVEALSIDVNGVGDISDTLTLSKSSGNGLVVAANIDIDGTSNLDDVDIDGTLNLGGTDLTATFAEINSALDGNTATAAEITAVCDGNTATAAEITAAADGIGVTIPRQKIIEIGDWDMDATTSVSIAHGLTYSKIIGARAIVRNDADDTRYVAHGQDSISFPTNDLFIDEITTTNVALARKTSGGFDSTDFNSTSYNRGWIVLDYID